MATASRAKVAPYVLTLPPHPSHLSDLVKEDRKDRRRNIEPAAAAGPCCSCHSLFLDGLGLATLLVASIAIPVMITFSNSNTETSSTASTTVIITTLFSTTVTDITSTATSTDTTFASTLISTGATTSASALTIATTSPSTSTTTDVSCSSTCTSQQTCVNGVCVGIGYLSCTLTWSQDGDGDIVVATPNYNIIYWDYPGPSHWTDYGELDVDNTNGTGPENVFWPSSGSVPPTGVYYVCFSQYNFNPNASSTNPITATVKIVRSANSTLAFTKTFTSYYKKYSSCDSGSTGLLGSFTYP